MSTLDALDQSLLGSSFVENSPIIVKAEDLENEGSGFDFATHFFEPQPGNSYIIKFLPNPRDARQHVTHRSLYRSLPDPERKGKNFHYVSSGNARTCPVLNLFFELNEQKKNGDAVAAKKIEKYISRSNQGCALVQILSSPNKEEIGMIRLFIFSTFGPNATIANMLNQKLNPTKQQIEAGFEAEDIFNIFSSSVIALTCEEQTLPNGRKGRDYTKSMWTLAGKERGAIVKMEDGSTHEFKKSDIELIKNGDAQATAYFSEFKKQLLNPDYDVKLHFAYKSLEDEGLDEATIEYLKTIKNKVNIVVPVIRDKSLAEIASFGKIEDSSEKNTTNIMQESIPDELKDIVQEGQSVDNKQDDIDDLLNDI